MTFSLSFKLSYRDIFIAVLIMLFAFVLRVVVTFDRAERDIGFDPLPAGTDQRAYVGLAELYEAKQWPTDPFYWQPGITYFLVGLRPMIGRSVGQMTLGLALVSSLACGFTVGTGWLLTRRRWGGYAAGLLLAVFPTAIFYSTTLLTESLAAVYVIFVLFFALWQHEKLALWKSAILGLLFGLLAITRTNLAALVVAWLVLLWLDTRFPRASQTQQQITPTRFESIQRFISKLLPSQFMIHTAVMLVFMALMIAPVTLWNRKTSSNGQFALVTDTGMIEMYRGNSRDADGMRSDNVALDVSDGEYLKVVMSDIKRDPLHFVELQLLKSGLYWSASEPGNNVDFTQNGTDVSPLLRALPLNFLMLAFVGWLGVLALWRTDRHASLFFTLAHILIFGGVLIIWVASRSKYPAVAPLCINAAYLIVPIEDAVRAFRTRRFHINHKVGLYAAWIVVLVLMLAGLSWSASNLPQQHPVNGLPDDLRRLDVVFDGKIKLVGWRPLPEWPAAQEAWSHFQRSYVVQLYWQTVEPVNEDYSAYLALVDNGERLAGIDREIGGVSFRPKPTSAWQAGETYAEIIGFYLPQSLPREQDVDIRLGVYKTSGEVGDANQEVFPVAATSLADQPTSIVIQRLGVFDTGYIGTELDGYSPTDAVFGGQIALKGYQLPTELKAGETVNIGVYWKALQEITHDYTVFLHLEDETGKVVEQFDGPPRDNMLVTSTWPPDYPIQDTIPLKMPDSAGEYNLFIGLYDTELENHDRLPAPTPDGRWLMTTITVSN